MRTTCPFAAATATVLNSRLAAVPRRPSVSPARGWAAAVLLLAGLAGASGLHAQVLLANFTAPSAAVVGTTITVNGCNFPAGITAADTLVTFTPNSGLQSGVTATANSVAVTLGTCYAINVTVPIDIVAGNAAVTVSNAATTTPQFSSENFSEVAISGSPTPITLNPPQPASALPGTLITLVASGFNSSTPIPAANVMVTIAPASGLPVSVPATGDSFTAPGVMQLTFQVPSGIAAGAATLAVSNQSGTTPPFFTPTPVAFTVLQQAPGTAPLGPVTTATVAAGLSDSVKANGLPSGNLVAGNILVTLTPPPGNGQPITVPATLYLSPLKQITFPISTGFVNNAPILCAITVTNAPGTSPAFSLTGASVTVTPPPTVVDVLPGAAQAGTSVPITLTGNFTHFGTTSSLYFTPFAQSTSVSTITASNLQVQTTGLLTATLNIAGNATPGAYTVNVQTGTEMAQSGAALVVTTTPGLSFQSIAPNGGALGQTLVGVAISATDTHFLQGSTVLDMGTGITVENLQVVDATDLLATLVISPTTSLGPRTVSAVTGGEFAVGVNAFTVQASPAALVPPLSPNSGAQGTNIVGLQITGNGTHFLPGATTVAFSGGIQTGQVTVISPTSLTVDLAIPYNAQVGAQNVTVTTGGEQVSLSGAFTVTPGTPFIASVTPNQGEQGQTLNVAIAGTLTNFQPNDVTVSFGAGDITVNSTTVDPINQIVTVNITVAQDAATGGRTATLISTTTTPSDYQFAFNVTPSPASIQSICVSPTAAPACVNSAPQNSAPTLLVTATGTNWVQGTTTVSGPIGFNVDVVTITSPTTATLNVTIAPTASVGPNTLTFTTGGQVVQGTFIVLASTPSLTMTPTAGMQGVSVPVTFTGSLTHFCDNVQFSCATGYTPTTAVIDGAGVSIQNFTVLSPASASATFVLAPDATLGTRTVTLTTGTEVVGTPFAVTNTPAVLTHITPGFAGPSGNVSVEITGQYTHFEQGVTTVTAGPDITVSDVVVNSSTDLTATFTMDGQTALGWRNIFVNTIDPGNNINEQLTIGFSIVSPVAPVFTGISPSSGYQGQVLTVTMTGVNTNWQQGVTQALVGGEVTVNSLTINGPTSATAVITISPYAPLGGNPIVMITGGEVDSGPGLTILAGPAQILGLCPNAPGNFIAVDCPAGPVEIAVGQTITINLTGQATHWLQGGTVAQFGNGSGQVYTDLLTIQDQTHAQAQVTVLTTATPGFIPVTMTTLGEVASIAQGIDLVNSAPELLSASPNSGQQGATLNVQVLGRFTHWCDGAAVPCATGYTPTVPDYPQGTATINSITVQDSQTAVLNLTVNPLAYPSGPSCPSLTLTTGTEQVTLLNAFCVTPGPATLTSVSPNSGPQGQTTTVTITGLETHFVAGQTVANFGAAVQAGDVQVIDATHATVDLGVTANAPVGFVNATLTTLGETATLDQAFQVVPGTPTLNEVSTVQGEQGQSFTGVQIYGQYTHFCDNVSITCGTGFTPTTVTFGQGITLSNLQVISSNEATVDLAIDPLAFTGSRDVTVTTGSEVVSRSNLFQIVAGPAIISQVTPSSANQGQEVVLAITGLNTHWQQGLTQFSIAGAGSDITVNSVVIVSPTSAQADVTVSSTAGLGARGVYMVTAGEALSDSGAVVITGGIPAIAGVSPGSALQGAANVNVTITGLFTDWLEGGVANVDFGTANGSGINLISYTVNSDTSITAVVDISPDAPLQYDKVTITGQTKNENGVLGVQALTGYFLIQSITPPTPYIQYMTPGSAIPGQTLDVTLYGAYTHWDDSTQITFGAGIEVLPGTFSVTSPTSAVVTLSVDPDATGGARTVYVTTGSEQEQTTFSVVIAQPVLSIVDPPSGLQGAQNLTVNVIGSYTSFNGTTTFAFGGPFSGITVTNVNVLGPTIAQVTLNIDQLAPLGGNSVTATTTLATGTQVVSGAGFSVTPSLATIVSVTPNTGYQGNGEGNGAAVQVTVTGEFTHWDGTTTFSFGDGITVSGVAVDSGAQTATMSLAIPPYASLGTTSVTATTGGEIATLNQAFVVQAGTPIVLSASTGNGGAVVQQQQTVPVTILGQVTQWDSTTTVTYGPGFLISTPVPGNLNCNGALNPGVVGVPLVTGPTAMTVCVTALPLTYTGSYSLTVVTADQGNQTLTLYNSLSVQYGPAAVTALTPASGDQGQTLDVGITGTNTNFVQGSTVATFGSGISVNTLTVNGPTSASANVTIAANAPPGLNTVRLTTLGEVATDPSAFTIVQATPVLTFINPASGAQNQTETVTVTALFTHFAASTQFDFGPGVTVNGATILSATSAQVNLTVLPTATTGTVSVTATTGTEVAAGANLFTITAGPAALASVSPNSGRQNQNGLPVTITGNGSTHFSSSSIVNLGSGITVTNLVVNSANSLTATVNISQSAPTGTNTVTVTTGGEVASLANGFTVLTGAPILTAVSPTSVNQGSSSLLLTVTGLYTHLNSGISGVTFSPNDISYVLTEPGATATQAVIEVNVSNAAALGTHSLTVTDTTDGSVNGIGLFSVIPGIPAVQSISPTQGTQGELNQSLTVNGNAFTSFSSSSVVSFSGSGVTAGPVQVNGPSQLTVPVSVAQGTTPGYYTITVTTGAQVASLGNAFQVLPGVPLLQSITQNVGTPNSTQTVAITGVFTNFQANTVSQPLLTTANFGPWVSVGGAAAGANGPIQVTSPTTATASLTIASGATLGAYNVTVTDPTDGTLTVTNGFTIQAASPVAPQIVATTPPNNATGVPTNTRYRFELQEPIQNASSSSVVMFDEAITGYNCNPGTTASVVPSLVTTDASGRIVTITPNQDLKVGDNYLVCIDFNGQGYGPPWSSNSALNIFSQSSSPLALPYAYYVFTTGFGPDTNGPQVTYTNISNGDTGVGTNAHVILGFNEPIDPTTITSTSFSVQQAGNPVSGTLSFNSSLTQAIFTPSSSFSANTVYTVAYTAGIADDTETPLSNPGSFTFTTAAGAVTSAPTFVSWTPCCSETTGLNPTVAFTMSAPVNPLSITPGTFYVYDNASGWTIPGATVSFSNDNQTVTLTLPQLLESGTSYTWYASGSDREGNTFGGNVTFVTDPPPTTAPDQTPPTVSSTNPANGSTNAVSTPLFQVQMNKDVDWTSVAGATLTLSPPAALNLTNCYQAAGNLVQNCGFESDNTAGWTVTGGGTGISGQSHSGTYSFNFDNDAPASTLSQTIADTNGASYTLSFWVYNAGGGSPELFQASWDGAALLNLGTTISTFNWTQFNYTVTGTGSDTLTFTAYNNPSHFLLDDITVVPVGSMLSTLYGSSLGADHETVSFGSALLTPGTPYTAVVAGLKDLDGNTMAPYSWSFTPASQALGTDTVSVGTPGATIVFTLNNPVDPASVNNASLHVFDNTVQGSSYALPGSYAISSSGTTVTFTPEEPFEPGHQICAYASYNATLYDTVGNPFTSATPCFTMPSGTPTPTPATVTFTPANGVTGIGPNNPVTVTFNQPMSPSSLTGNNNVGLYKNGALVTSSVTVSHDTTAFTFSNGTLTFGATYTIVVGPNVTDLTGTPLGSEYSSTFTVMPAPPTSGPQLQTNLGCNLCVTGFRPGAGATGVAATNPATFFLSSPVNAATVVVGSANSSGTLYIAQNGVLIDGQAVVDSSGHVITFTPAGNSFTPGAVVEVYLTNGITDNSGNALQAYSTSFTVAAAVAGTAPTLVSLSPGTGSNLNPTNTVVDARFNQPMNPATAITSNFYVTLSDGRTVVPGSVSVLNGGALLRFTPATSLAQNSTYYIFLTGGLANLTGQTFAGSSSQAYTYFSTGTAIDPGNLQVTGMEPVPGTDANVGTNALIRLTFNFPLELGTVDANTLTLTSGSQSIPYTYTWQNSNGSTGFPIDGPNQLVLTPQSPLPVGAPVTVTVTPNVTDTAGLPAVQYTGTFQTSAAGPNFTIPQVTSVNVANGDVNVPIDSVFTITFNEPMDTRSFQLGSTIVLGDNFLNAEVPAIMSYTADGTVVTVAPETPLAEGRSYYLGVANVFDLTGNENSGGWASYQSFTTALTPEGNLAVVTTTPSTGDSSGVATNIHPEILFNRPISEPSAVANITLAQGATNVPITLSFSKADTEVTVVPNTVLAPDANYSLNIAGGPTGLVDASAGFAPAVVVASLHTGDATAGVNLSGGSADPNWTVTGPYVPEQQAVVLSPGSRYSGWAANDVNSQWIGVIDSPQQAQPPYTFTTHFDLTGYNPATAALVLQWSVDNDGYLSLNGTPIASSNNNFSLQSVTVMGSSGLLLPGVNTLTITLSYGDRQTDGARLVGTVTALTPQAPAPSTYLASSFTLPFTTANALEITNPSLVSITPPSNAITGVNPLLQVRMSEPIDPLRSTQATLYNYVTGNNIPLIATWSADGLTGTFSYAGYVNSQGTAGTLDPATQYQLATGSLYDLAGNGPVSYTTVFTTGSGPVSGPPTMGTVGGLTSVTPIAGSSNVPLNPVISATFTTAIAPTTLLPGGITISPAAAGSVSLSTNGLTLSYVLSAPLAPNTLYTVSIAAGAFSDVNGNVATASSYSFTTGSLTVTGAPTISLTSPAPGTNGVSVTAPVTITLSRPVDPLSVTASSFEVCIYNNCNLPFAGNIAISPDGTQLTFSLPTYTTGTPPVQQQAQWPQNTELGVYAGWAAPLYDEAGNQFNDIYGAYFTTGSASAPTPPQVLSVTPPPGQTGVGPEQTVTLLFNEALNSSTINSTNFALYNGYTNLNASVGQSSDRRMVTLSTTLPYNSVITVYAGTGVQDVAGDSMASAYTSTFTTIPRPDIAAASVTQIRPAAGASGVAPTSPITIYTSTPVNASTVTSTSLVVLNNGVQVAGSYYVGQAPATAEGQTIVFVPSQPFADGSSVQVFLNPTVTDVSGNAFTSYSAQFTTASPSNPATSGPNLVSITPSNGNSSASNAVVIATFDQPIVAADVTGSNFYISTNSNGTGTPVPATVTQLAPNELELTPTVPLSATWYYVYLTSGLQNSNNLPINTGSQYVYASDFNPSAVADNNTPTVLEVAPTNGAGGVGDNVELNFTFSENVATATISPDSVTLTANGTPVPFTLSFSETSGNAGTEVTLVPQVPLPDNGSIQLMLSSGAPILNVAGAAVPEVTVDFSTGDGPDFSAPVIVSESPNTSLQNQIPTNTTFTFVFNEPLAPNSVYHNAGVSLYDYGTGQNVPTNVSLSGGTVTFSPGPLTPGVQYQVCVQNVSDLAGNVGGGTCIYPTVGSGPATGLQLLYSTPLNGANAVPTNGIIDLAFNEQVSAASLGALTLTPNGGSPLPVSASLIDNGTIVRVTPSALLLPNTQYTLAVVGVTDLSGTNVIAPGTNLVFNTGTGTQIGNQTAFTSALVYVSTGGQLTLPAGNTPPGPTGIVIDATHPVTLNFSKPVEEASLNFNNAVHIYTYNGNVAVPFSVVLTNNGMTALITPTGSLSSGTEYVLTVDYNGTIYDQAGYSITGGTYYYFTSN